MKILLYFLSVMSLLFGAMVVLESRTSVHEILAVCVFINASVLLSGGCVVGAIERKRQ
jgi:uncharacterized membrane protein